MALNNEPTATTTVAQTGFTETANSNEPIHQVDVPSPYTFGATSAVQPIDVMDFAFEIDDLLGPMKAIASENPQWMQTMMLPGWSWPTDESYPYFGNSLATEDYQNFLPPQPAAVRLG